MNYAELYEKTKDEIGFSDSAPIPYIVPTGSVFLDRALAIGGLPGGRVVEIFGPESSGKTTLGMHILSSAQSMGLEIGLLDMEAALDPVYAESIGLQGKPNVDWAYAVPDFGEQALETLRFWVSQGIKVILVDSVSAMVPKAEAMGEFGEAHMGLQARMMSQGLRVLTTHISKNGALVVFINQIRTKIGVMYGSPETTTGGRALPFYSSIRLETRANGEDIKMSGDVVGKYSTIKIKKSKVGPPLRSVQIPICYGRGIYKPAEVFDVLLSDGRLIRRGSNYYVDGELIGAGKSAAMDTIKQNMGRYRQEAKDESTED